MIAHRPGYPIGEMQASLPGPLRQAFLQRLVTGPQALRLAPAGSILTREITALNVSATAIRAELAAGGSGRYLVPDPVLEYIGRNSLYKEADAG